MMDRERPSASDAEGTIPEAWIGQEVMLETTGWTRTWCAW